MRRKKKINKYPPGFRKLALERMKTCRNVSELSAELGIHRTQLYKWRRAMEAADDGYDPPANSGERELRKQLRELKCVLAEKVLEAGSGFFQRCLAKGRGSTAEQRRLWRDGVFEEIRELMTVQGNLGVERMCQLVDVSRASFYRSLKERAPAEEDVAVRSAIQEVVLEHRRRYGSRRVTKALRRRGMIVNRKRVGRIMREDNLLAIQPRSFVVTTDSDHELEVYLNVASRMKVKGVNQLWVADITYIRLKTEFVYLAVILDAHLRKVVGWELDQTLATRLPLAALVRAIAKRKPRPGLVHHSDRGVQYASGDYVGVLRRHQMIPSMSRPANPYDNASCESFIKTLKREEVYATEYRDIEHLRANIEEFIDRYYKRCRLHSALGYQSPEEFERADGAGSAGATMSFFRHAEIYRSDRKRGRRRKPTGAGFPDHRLDESPAGYSSAGCSPAEPASASPAEAKINEGKSV